MNQAPHRARLLVASMLSTFVFIRVLMWISPDADFNVAGYNIHHLYPGLLLAVAGGIPLILWSQRSRATDLACLTFGCGLSLALDEWVYLIVTDGSNAAYLLPVSFWGEAILVALACLYAALLSLPAREGPSRPGESGSDGIEN